jgi:hypothetical protein
MSDQRTAIEAFWAWWPSVEVTIAEAFRSGGLSEELVLAVNAHVHAIHPKLDWEFGPGTTSQHHLCLSGKGDPTLRVVAERWLHRAPKPTATWEFHASRQPHPDGGLVLEIAGHKVALDELVAAVTEDDTREKLDVKLHHPVFAALEDRNLKVQIIFIGLDTLLGEDDVERWIGAIELAETRPPEAIPFAALRDRIKTFATKATQDKWIIMKGEREGAPLFVTINAALKRVNHLLLDTHVTVTITLASPTKDGLTTKEEAEVLGAMDDALAAALGDGGVYIGRETGMGKRVLHYHVMTRFVTPEGVEGGPSASVLARWRTQYPAYAIEVAVTPDPMWEVLDRWR